MYYTAHSATGQLHKSQQHSKLFTVIDIPPISSISIGSSSSDNMRKYSNKSIDLVEQNKQVTVDEAVTTISISVTATSTITKS